MTEVLQAFHKAFQDLLRPRVFAMVLLPVLAATALWAFLGWFFWARYTGWLNGLLFATSAGKWIAGWSPGTTEFLIAALALALIAPCVLITAMVITEFFTMPGLVNFVAQRYYPTLQRRHGGTIWAGVVNSVVAITLFVMLWLVTLPLWFTGIGAVLVPLLNSAYLNQRIFRHDALSDHASRDELRVLNSTNRRKLFVLGLLPAGFLYVPLVNLLVPALTGLAFTHYQLHALARIRSERAN